MFKPIRWGILGTGTIAKQFTEGLRSLPEAQVFAIASRTLASAEEFASRYNIPKAYSSYEALLNNPEVDVVYIATPNFRHKDDCLLCLEANKPFLCEKPFALNTQEAREVVTLARQKGLFCMEAMWMRFMPLIREVKSQISKGTIGQIQLLIADFGYPVHLDPNNRIYNPQLGGGTLLDRGVYPLSLAFYLLGKPEKVVSISSFATTGIDDQTSLLLSYQQGCQALLSSTIKARTTNEAVIIGSKGQIRIEEPFYRPHRISIKTFKPVDPSGINSPSKASILKEKLVSSLKSNSLLKHLYWQFESNLSSLKGTKTKEIVLPYEGNGYNFEAAEVMQCLQRGALESQIMPLDETISILEIIDLIRQQWNEPSII